MRLEVFAFEDSGTKYCSEELSPSMFSLFEFHDNISILDYKNNNRENKHLEDSPISYFLPRSDDD